MTFVIDIPALQASRLIQLTAQVENSEKRLALTQLLTSLFINRIHEMDIEKSSYRHKVTIHLTEGYSVKLLTTTLHIPKKVQFYFHVDGLMVFDKGHEAPFETPHAALSTDYYCWFQLKVEEKDFQIFSILFYSDRKIPIAALLSALQYGSSVNPK